MINNITENEIIKQWKNSEKKVRTSFMPITVQWLSEFYIWWKLWKRMLILKPEYQRLYKWTKQQKTDLIESILLWIPIPPLFFAQTIDSKYEIIDWLQRVSTVLEYIWDLEDKFIKEWTNIKNGLWKPRYLTYLEWKKFSDLPFELKNKIFVHTFHVNVLSDESNIAAKYELFNRLNSWWTPLTKQEIRNTLIIQFRKELYDFFMELRWENQDYENDFITILSPSEKDIDSETDTEFILRFFSLVYFNWSKNEISSISTFLDDMMKKFIKWDYDIINNKNIFLSSFKLINNCFWSNSLKRFNVKKNNFSWRVIVPAFDAIAWWIWYNLKERNIPKNCIEDNECIEKIRKRIKALWMSDQWNKHIRIWWFIEHKLQVAMFIWRELFNLDRDFWNSEEEIAKKIDELIDKKFNK